MANEPKRPVTATDLSHALRGIDFPCSKEDLKRHAVKNEAPQDIMGTIERMEEKQFLSMADVEHSFHQVRGRR